MANDLAERPEFKSFKERPFFFLVRQFYKIFVVFPYNLVLDILFRAGWGRDDGKISHAEVEHVFLISSVIYSLAGKKVSYNGTRTIFTPEQRAEQTLKTIRTIHEKIPGAKAVIVEAGLPGEALKKLAEAADQYIYVGDKKMVRLATDSKVKSLGESMMLLAALPSLKFSAKYYFKMSGRYFLNDEFRINDWHREKYVFRCFRDDYFCTRLYGFSGQMLVDWKFVLLKGLPFNLIDYPIENTLSRFISKKDITNLPRIGCSGVGASSSEVIND